MGYEKKEEKEDDLDLSWSVFAITAITLRIYQSMTDYIAWHNGNLLRLFSVLAAGQRELMIRHTTIVGIGFR